MRKLDIWFDGLVAIHWLWRHCKNLLVMTVDLVEFELHSLLLTRVADRWALGESGAHFTAQCLSQLCLCNYYYSSVQSDQRLSSRCTLCTSCWALALLQQDFVVINTYSAVSQNFRPWEWISSSKWLEIWTSLATWLCTYSWYCLKRNTLSEYVISSQIKNCRTIAAIARAAVTNSW